MGAAQTREQLLVQAAKTGNLETARNLLIGGCFANHNDCEALMAAAAAGHKKLVLFLFDHGAQPESNVCKIYYSKPLLLLLFQGRMEAIDTCCIKSTY